MRIFHFPSTCGRGGGPLLAAVLLAALPCGLDGQHPGELRGRVVDAVTGRGVAAARIALPAAGVEMLADGEGGVYFRGLPPGEIEVVAERFGYRGGRIAVRVRNGEVTRFELALSPEALAAPGISVDVAGGGPAVLEGEAVRRAGARTAGDLVATLPGATVVRRGAGGVEEIRLRGGAGEHVLVLVDGVALNDPVTGVADLSAVPAGGIERIELLPGARTARYGAGALAGVVVIETRRGGGPAEAVLRGGSLGERGGSLRGSHRIGSLSLSAGASESRTDGSFGFDLDPSLGGGAGVRRNADVRESEWRIGAEGAFGPTRWDARLGVERLERGVPGKSFAPSDSARQGVRGSRFALRSAVEGRTGSIDLQLRSRDREIRFRDPAPPLGPPFDDLTRLRETGGTLRGELAPGAGASFLGAELDVVRRSLRGDALAHAGPVRTLDGSLGVYGEVPDIPLPLAPAIHAAFRLHRDGRSGAWLPAHEITLRRAFGDGEATFGAHLSWRSSFSPPSAGDLHFREGVGVAPNPDLRPERVPSEVEIGASAGLRLGPAVLDLSGELFGGDLEDMIVWTPDFRFTWSPRNVDVRRRGVELRAGLRHPSSGFEATGHFSSTRATYVGGGGTPGVQVVYRPRDSAGLAVGWSGEGWHGRLRGRYTGLRYPVRAAANALEPFWVFELTAGRRVRAGAWTVEPLLRVDRLFDERTPFIHAFPEPGRTIRLELRVAPPTPLRSPSSTGLPR